MHFHTCAHTALRLLQASASAVASAVPGEKQNKNLSHHEQDHSTDAKPSNGTQYFLEMSLLLMTDVKTRAAKTYKHKAQKRSFSEYQYVLDDVFHCR